MGTKSAQWVQQNKKGVLIGFVIGAVLAPLVALLGLSTPFFEILRPLLVGPMDLVGVLLPNVELAPGVYHAPAYKWILALGANGVCYAIAGGVIQHFRKT